MSKLSFFTLTAALLIMTACGNPAGGGDTTQPPAPTGEHKLLSFGLVLPTVVGGVDEEAGTVMVRVPSSTSLTNLVPRFTSSVNSLVLVGVVQQVSETSQQDFTSPVVYKVVGADGVSKDYTVTVVKADVNASSNTRLSTLTVTGTTLSPLFNPDTSAYTADVSVGTSGVTLEASAEDSGATFLVNGAGTNSNSLSKTFDLVYGENLIEFTLVAADGTFKNYSVTITRANPVAQLLNIALVDPAVLGIINETNKTVAFTVPSTTDVTSLVLSFTLSDGAQMIVNGVALDTNSTAQNLSTPLSVTVKSIDDSTADYILTVNKASDTASSDNKLSALTLSTGTVAFNPDVTTYSLEVENNVSSLLITPETLATGATLLIDGVVASSSEVVLNEGSQSVIITVVAENGLTRTYQLLITKKTAPVYENKLLSFGFNTPSVTAQVDGATKTVTATVPYGTDLTALVAQFTVSDGASVSVNGLDQSSGVQSQNYGSPVNFRITSQNGIYADYTVIVVLAANNASTNNNLLALTTTAGTLNFSQDVSDYSLSVAATVTDLSLTATLDDIKSALYVNGVEKTSGSGVSVPLSAGPNTVTILVTAENGSSKTYTISVKKAWENKLKSFEFTNPAVSAKISNTTGSVALTVPYGTDLKNLVATFSSSEGSVVTSYDEVQVSGSTVNDFTAPVEYVVTDPEGQYKVYSVVVSLAAKESSGDYNLASLVLQGLALNTDFNPATTEYAITVPNEIAELSLLAVASSLDADIKINGISVTTSGNQAIPLVVGPNTILIQVQAENGLVQTYTLMVTRSGPLSSVKDLSALTISAGTLNPAFSSGVTSYTAMVANTVTALTVIPTKIDSKSTVVISGGTNLVEGPNTVTITVTAQDMSQKVYTLTVTRGSALSGNNNLNSLTLSQGTLSPAFTSANLSYTATVSNSATSITVNTVKSEVNALVTVAGAQNLVVGANTVTVTVEAQNGTQKVYTITVTREPASSTNNNLGNLSLSSGTLTPGFSAETLNYSAIVANSVTTVTVTAPAADSSATRVIVGGQNLVVGSNTITITVTAQSGATKIYTVTLTREASTSTNNNLATLALNVGDLTPAFSPEITSYSAAVVNTVTSVTVNALKADNSATLVVSGGQTLTEGSNTITITVTAQNGAVKTYVINVLRSLPSGVNIIIDNDLQDIVINFSGTAASLAQGNNMTVVATTSKPVSTYRWVLNGVDQTSTTNSITLGSALALGSYNLTLIVSSATKLASANIPFTVIPAQNTGNVDLSVDASALTTFTVDLGTAEASTVQGSNYTLTATATMTPDAYKWYLDGKIVASQIGSVFALPAETTVGFHRVDVMTIKGARLASDYHMFQVTANQIQTVATPSFSVASSEVVSGTTVTLSTATSGATIKYTVDGTDPITSATVITGASTSISLSITQAQTIKAYAVKTGMNASTTATVAYTIKAVTGGITVHIPATYGEAQTIHYWAVTASPAVADTVWTAKPALTNVDADAWMDYTIPGATAASFLFNGTASTPNQTVTASGEYWLHYSAGWKLVTTKPAL